MTRETGEGTIALQAQAGNHPETSATTIYYDGSCPLCTAEIKHYTARPGGDALHLVDVSAEGAGLGPDLAADDAMRRFHVRTQEGELRSGARAFVEVWRALPGWRWAARLAMIPGVIPLMEAGYRAFLPLRPGLSRLGARAGLKPANPKQR